MTLVNPSSSEFSSGGGRIRWQGIHRAWSVAVLIHCGTYSFVSLEPRELFPGKGNRNCVTNSRRRESFQRFCSSHQGWWMMDDLNWARTGAGVPGQSPLMDLAGWVTTSLWWALCTCTDSCPRANVWSFFLIWGRVGSLVAVPPRLDEREEWVSQETLGSCHLEKRSGVGQAQTSPLLCGLHSQHSLPVSCAHSCLINLP